MQNCVEVNPAHTGYPASLKFGDFPGGAPGGGVSLNLFQMNTNVLSSALESSSVSEDGNQMTPHASLPGNLAFLRVADDTHSKGKRLINSAEAERHMFPDPFEHDLALYNLSDSGRIWRSREQEPLGRNFGIDYADYVPPFDKTIGSTNHKVSSMIAISQCLFAYFDCWRVVIGQQTESQLHADYRSWKPSWASKDLWCWTNET